MLVRKQFTARVKGKFPFYSPGHISIVFEFFDGKLRDSRLKTTLRCVISQSRNHGGGWF